MATFLFLPIILIFGYIVLLRPQQQRLRAQRSLVASLDVGDEIITAGGIIGRIVALTGDRASVEVADGVVIDFLRVAISRRSDLADRHAGTDEDADLDLSDDRSTDTDPDDRSTGADPDDGAGSGPDELGPDELKPSADRPPTADDGPR